MVITTLVLGDIVTVKIDQVGTFQLSEDPKIVEGNTIREVTRFTGSDDPTAPEDFKHILVDNGQMLIGSRNRVYVLSSSDLKKTDVIQWQPSPSNILDCTKQRRTDEECQNYIRVIVKTSEQQIMVCGTNAYKPWCRAYNKETPDKFSGHPVADLDGIALCPFDPKSNNTAIYAGDRLISATFTDFSARDALIYGKPLSPTTQLQELRTEQFSSQVLNEPNFVNSLEYGDKVYFFYRETAVEAINCEKTVYSRVGRVCKNDQGGGQLLLKNSWTSYFKARLNCSKPGLFPFYFDEIQSTSSVGEGNYMPSISINNRTSMIYAVFNTPENSIHGSAVCAFRFDDIQQSFEGSFKDKKNPDSVWLPLSKDKMPEPHPAQSCANASQQLNDYTLNVIKSHPIMDKAVPAFGGRPILIDIQFTYRLSAIAIDWQVYAADNKRYDIIFVGTTDGRVLKVINRGGGPDNMNTVVIEDIKVFSKGEPIVNLNVRKEEGRLLVVSKAEVKSILLHRCHLQDTCSNCVKLQDPYCSWDSDLCRHSRNGFQSIETGKHHKCTDNPKTTPKVDLTTTTTTEPPTCAPCPVCTVEPSVEVPRELPNLLPTTMDRRTSDKTTTELSNEIPTFAEPNTGAMAMDHSEIYTRTDMALAVCLSIFCTLVLTLILMILATRRGYITIFSPKSGRDDQPNPPFDMKKSDTLESRKEKNDNLYQAPVNLVSPKGNMPNNIYIPNDNRNVCNVVVNEISGRKSPGKSLNENIETSLSPKHKTSMVYL